MEEKKSVKGLVDENVTRHEDARLMRGEVRRGNLFGKCEILFRKHASALLSLSFRNKISHINHSGTPQSLLNSNHLTHLTHLTHFTHLRKRPAFTLAETLITLAVIGIVAAMTIPTLVSNYQKKVFATKAKQTYSILSNALALSEIDNGAPDGWFIGEVSDSYSGGTQETLTHIVETYFKPYFKVAEDLGYADGHYSIVLNNGMTLTFTTDSTIINDGSSVKYLPTAIYVIASNNKNTKSRDDSSRDYSKHDLFFKINMISKRFFPFAWSNNQPNLHDYTTIKSREELIDHVKYGCSKTIAKNKRFNCGALIMFDGWEIKDDYPW